MAAVAYGMRAEDLVFWLDAIGEGKAADRGVLCQRHGDSMVVPRGWTLDDQRDPHLHLFRPPKGVADDSSPAKRRRPKADDDLANEQLALGGMVDATHGAPDQVDDEPSSVDTDVTLSETATAGVAVDGEVLVDGSVDDVAVDEAVESGSWKPSFDDADDLDGLLAASSPLLSRAFRVNDRPD